MRQLRLPFGDNSRRQRQLPLSQFHRPARAEQHFYCNVICTVTDHGSHQGTGQEMQPIHVHTPYLIAVSSTATEIIAETRPSVNSLPKRQKPRGFLPLPSIYES